MMKDLSNQRWQGHCENAVHKINRSGLMEAYRDQKASMGSELDPLHICNSCVPWCSCVTPNGGIGSCLWSFFCLHVEPFPPTRSSWPVLAWWSLPRNLPCLVDGTWRPALFYRETDGNLDGREVVENFRWVREWKTIIRTYCMAKICFQ